MSCQANRTKMMNVGSEITDGVPKQIIPDIDCTVSSSSLTSEMYHLTTEVSASTGFKIRYFFVFFTILSILTGRLSINVDMALLCVCSTSPIYLHFFISLK